MALYGKFNALCRVIIVVPSGEASFKLQEQSGQCLRISFHLIKKLIFQFGDLIEVVEQGFSLKNPGIGSRSCR